MTEFRQSLPPNRFAAAFPFHVVLDAELRVLQMGDALHRACPDVEDGQAFADAFDFVKPSLVAATYEALNQYHNSVFLVRAFGASLHPRIIDDPPVQAVGPMIRGRQCDASRKPGGAPFQGAFGAAGQLRDAPPDRPRGDRGRCGFREPVGAVICRAIGWSDGVGGRRQARTLAQYPATAVR